MPVATTTLAIFAASQIGTPGPANMALLANGARFGLRAAMPFVLGVAAGKQFVIWPVGFGLMELAARAPWVFETLKWLSAAYICWLAWRVANMRLTKGESAATPPGFLAGLMVHPLNPKAWGVTVTSFAGFVSPDTPTFQATATVAVVLLSCQLVLHPIWTFAGEKIAATVAGTKREAYLMWTLAALTVLSVLFVLFNERGSL